MVALSDRKIAIVRTLVESAPDRIVGGLQRALAESAGDTVLASVRQLVEAEAADRMLRNAVFQPVVPLFVGDGSDKHSLVFPARALATLWRGLKGQEMAAGLAPVTRRSAGRRAAAARSPKATTPDHGGGRVMRRRAAGSRRRPELCDQARPAV